MSREQLFETHAREKIRMPPEWVFWRVENIGPPGQRIAIKVTGCVPGIFKGGPRKGQPNYDKPVPGTDREVWLLVAEHEAWKAEWEQKTGKCWRCVGHGNLPWKSGPDGAVMRPCDRCGGTGKAAVGVVATVEEKP